MWRMNLPASQRIELEYEDEAFEVLAKLETDGWSFQLHDETSQVDGKWLDRERMRVEIDRQRIEFPLLREPGALSLIYQGQAFRFVIPDRTQAGDSDAADADHPQAPMSGAVVAVPVGVGDTVEPGDTLIVIEAMKMEHAIVAQVGASVSEILVAVGDQVNEGDTLVLLEVD